MIIRWYVYCSGIYPKAILGPYESEGEAIKKKNQLAESEPDGYHSWDVESRDSDVILWDRIDIEL